jgi:hypothetical protein
VPETAPPVGYNRGMRFRLRTLLILAAVVPLILTAWWFEPGVGFFATAALVIPFLAR